MITDRGVQFTSRFWRSLKRGLGTQVNLNTNVYPQTYGQAERTIQSLEDMLRDYIIDYKENWDEHLPLVEFSYNNRVTSGEHPLHVTCVIVLFKD